MAWPGLCAPPRGLPGPPAAPTRQAQTCLLLPGAPGPPPPPRPGASAPAVSERGPRGLLEKRIGAPGSLFRQRPRRRAAPLPAGAFVPGRRGPTGASARGAAAPLFLSVASQCRLLPSQRQLDAGGLLAMRAGYVVPPENVPLAAETRRAGRLAPSHPAVAKCANTIPTQAFHTLWPISSL